MMGVTTPLPSLNMYMQKFAFRAKSQVNRMHLKIDTNANSNFFDFKIGVLKIYFYVYTLNKCYTMNHTSPIKIVS